MTVVSVAKADLGPLSALAEGRLGRVFRVESFSLPGEEAPLVYKEFRTDLAGQARSASAGVAFRAGLSDRDRAEFDQRWLWPKALVAGDNGAISGYLMPLIPADFFCHQVDSDTSQIASRPRELTWLIASTAQRSAARVDIPDIDRHERLVLLTELVRSIAWLHEHGWVFGDLTLNSAVFALGPPRLMLLDCDGAAPLSDPTRKQYSTPFWNPPECSTSPSAGGRPQELQDTITDVYKLGLAVLRCLTPGKGAGSATAVDRLADVLDAEGTELIARALSADRAIRPSARELFDYLDQLISPRVARPPKALTMPPLPARPLAASGQPGERLALIVATTDYADSELRHLRAPATDAADLAAVLADPAIGDFTVTTVLDEPAPAIRLAIEDFLADRGIGDLLLVYLSCHGLLDAHRRLYFAATDTRKNRLGSTGVESAWILDQLEHCRARKQVLILDSCFSGAFAHGTKGDSDLDLKDRFIGEGRGRVILTASTATEYSFEGEPLDASTPVRSVFTAALVEGLRTGSADADRDGYVSVDEAYAYVFDQVQAAGAAQTPQRWLYGGEGAIVLARNPSGPAIAPEPLPEALRIALESPYPNIRLAAITELGRWLADPEPARIQAARQHLEEVAENDIPRIAATARALLGV